MAEYPSNVPASSTGTDPAQRRHPETGCGGFSPASLIVGLAALAVAAYVLADGAIPLGHGSLRWIGVGIAVVVGISMLAASVSGRTRR
ncbi:MAG: hypothetical protein ACRDRL_11825 [Sciscionella sp.]